MQLTKQIVKVGNGAGVLVPRAWLDGKATVELIEKPIDLQKDILEILEGYMPDILSIAIVGSYARNEQTPRSDIDVLVITHSTSKQIKQGKYNLILISEKSLEKELQRNILPWLPMLKEAKPVINAQLIERLSKTQITKKNLEPHIELTKSALDLNEAHLSLDEENGKITSDAVAYSLVLRARGAYIVDCLINKNKSTTKTIRSIIKNKSGSLKAYEGYIRVKDDKKTKKDLPIEEARKLLSYIKERIKEQELWAKRKN